MERRASEQREEREEEKREKREREKREGVRGEKGGKKRECLGSSICPHKHIKSYCKVKKCTTVVL